jgi:hypothetical protein
LIVCAALAVFALACASDGPMTVDRSPLQGLTKVASNDSSSGTPEGPTNSPTTPGTPSDTGGGVPTPPPGPGEAHGFVLGVAEPGSGSDTLATSPRIADVRVTAYPRLESSGPELKTGPAAASVLTDGKGEFKLPSLPGGQYIVTFNPPEGSKYAGVYVTGTIHSRSGDYAWWIVLPKK